MSIDDDANETKLTLLVLALELLDEMVDGTVVKVLIIQVRALTSKIPALMVRSDASKVPPPRSKMRTLRLPWTFLSRP